MWLTVFGLALITIMCMKNCHGVVWTMNNYPSPTKHNSNACKKLANSSWFCDPDAVIGEYYEINIERLLLLTRLRAKSPCYGNIYNGFRVGVAVAQAIVKDGTSIKERAKNFAYFLRRIKWKISKDPTICDDSVLLMLFVQERYVYISTGEKARVLLPDGAVNLIIDVMIKDLAYDRFGIALEKGTAEIYSYLSKSKVYKVIKVKESKKRLETWQALLMVAGSILGTCLFCLFLIACKRCSPIIEGNTGTGTSGTENFWIDGVVGRGSGSGGGAVFSVGGGGGFSGVGGGGGGF